MDKLVFYITSPLSRAHLQSSMELFNMFCHVLQLPLLNCKWMHHANSFKISDELEFCEPFASMDSIQHNLLLERAKV